jgi:hypothetical protein
MMSFVFISMARSYVMVRVFTMCVFDCLRQLGAVVSLATLYFDIFGKGPVAI